MYPRILGYENMTNQMDTSLNNVVHFFGMPMHAKMKEFVQTHTKAPPGARQEVWNTFRDTDALKDHWKHEMAWSEVLDIQAKCRQALKYWGYDILQNEEELNSFKNP